MLYTPHYNPLDPPGMKLFNPMNNFIVLSHSITLLPVENIDDQIVKAKADYELEQMAKNAWWAPTC